MKTKINPVTTSHTVHLFKKKKKCMIFFFLLLAKWSHWVFHNARKSLESSPKRVTQSFAPANMRRNMPTSVEVINLKIGLMSAIQTWSQRHSPQCCSGLLSVDYVSVYFDSRKDTTPDVTTLVERSEKPMCVHVVWMMCFPFRFTPGVAAQLEKKRTGPSQADVEAIKVHLLTKTWSPVWVLRPGPEFQSVPQPKC